MLNLRELRYFLTVVQEGSITTAAAQLHMAQPPLSRQMKQLEETLGCKLFERGSRKIVLTEAGRLFRTRAEQMLKLMDTTINEVKDLETGTHGTLSIGTASSSGVTILPKVANIFHLHHPNLKFELWEGESIRIIELVKSGIVEIGLVRFSFDTDTFDSIRLPQEPLVAGIHTKYLGEFAKSAEINLKDLTEKPLMIHRKYEEILTEYCHQTGFTPHFLCKSDDIMPILAWADAGVGIAIVPRAAIGLIPTNNLIFKTITNPFVHLSAAVIWMRSRPLSASAQQFLDLFITLHTLD